MNDLLEFVWWKAKALIGFCQIWKKMKIYTEDHSEDLKMLASESIILAIDENTKSSGTDVGQWHASYSVWRFKHQTNNPVDASKFFIDIIRTSK